MQATINVNGDKICVKVRRSTHCGNFNGYIANVNGWRFRIMELVPIATAIELAYVKYIKTHR